MAKKIKIFIAGFLAVLVCTVAPLPSWAQGQEAPPPLKDSAMTTPNGRYYFDFKSTKLIQVLTLLSQLTGINFVAGKEIADREVNMVLDNVSLEDVLEAISKGSNVVYDYLPSRNIYLFRAGADAENLPALMTRVFHLYYVLVSPIREIRSSESSTSGSSSTASSSFQNLSEASQEKTENMPIVTAVQNILSERGRVNVDDRSNSLIVTDAEDRLRMIEQVIAELDKRLDQVLIEVILIETTEDLGRHLGIEWSSTASEGTFGVVHGGIARTRFPFDLKYPFSGKEIFGKESVTREEINTPLPVATTFGTKDFSNLTITLKLLQNAQKVKVLAKPRILVLDNHPALIKITTNAAIGQNTVSTATGQLTSAATTTTERTETGTALRLTPHINADSKITMTVEPRFVTLAASAVTDLADSTADPTIRTARTTLMVDNGQTLVIGGLLSSQQTNSERKVPLLGDVPGLSEIFTKRTKQIDNRELILFITPRIIHDPSELQAAFIPDEKEYYEDAKAPFWKYRSKQWYRELAKKASSKEAVETEKSILKRQARMDEAIKQLDQVDQEKKPAPSPIAVTPKTSPAAQPQAKKS